MFGCLLVAITIDRLTDLSKQWSRPCTWRRLLIESENVLRASSMCTVAPVASAHSSETIDAACEITFVLQSPTPTESSSFRAMARKTVHCTSIGHGSAPELLPLLLVRQLHTPTVVFCTPGALSHQGKKRKEGSSRTHLIFWRGRCPPAIRTRLSAFVRKIAPSCRNTEAPMIANHHTVC